MQILRRLQLLRVCCRRKRSFSSQAKSIAKQSAGRAWGRRPAVLIRTCVLRRLQPENHFSFAASIRSRSGPLLRPAKARYSRLLVCVLRKPRPDSEYSFLIFHSSFLICALWGAAARSRLRAEGCNLRPAGRSNSPFARLRAYLATGIDLGRGRAGRSLRRRRPAVRSRTCVHSAGCAPSL